MLRPSGDHAGSRCSQMPNSGPSPVRNRASFASGRLATAIRGWPRWLARTNASLVPSGETAGSSASSMTSTGGVPGMRGAFHTAGVSVVVRDKCHIAAVRIPRRRPLVAGILGQSRFGARLHVRKPDARGAALFIGERHRASVRRERRFHVRGRLGRQLPGRRPGGLGRRLAQRPVPQHGGPGEGRHDHPGTRAAQEAERVRCRRRQRRSRRVPRRRPADDRAAAAGASVRHDRRRSSRCRATLPAGPPSSPAQSDNAGRGPFRAPS